MNRFCLQVPPEVIPEEEARRRWLWLGWAYAALTAVMVVATFGLQFAVVLLCPAYATAWWMNWVLSLLPLYGVGLPALLFLLKFVPKAPHNATYHTRDGRLLPKPSFGVGRWLILLCMGFGCLYLGGLLGNLTMLVLSAVTGYDYTSGLNTLVESSPWWMTVLGACIIAPLGEELIFRKLLIDRTRPFGDGVSILVSGLLFALFHGNLFQFFYAFLVGALLAYVYTRSGSYLWCVLMHAVINLFGSVIIPSLTRLLPETGIPATVPQLLLVLALVVWQYGLIIAAAVLFFTLLSKRKLSRGIRPLTTLDARRLLILNPGMIACVLVMLLLLLSNLLMPLIPL